VSYNSSCKATSDFASRFFESVCCESGGEGSRYYARDFHDVNSCGGSGFYLFANALGEEFCAPHNAEVN
jgi:hypothetical protein